MKSSDIKLHRCVCVLKGKRHEDTAFIFSIPDEILSEIFKICHADAKCAQLDNQETPPSLEVTVSHVCRHWRAVAISTSSLWSSIDLLPNRSAHEIQTYLQRSQSYPLEIRIDVTDENWPPHANVGLIFDMLLFNVSRWCRVAISCDFKGDRNPMLARLRNPDLIAPQLEHLSISVLDVSPGTLHYHSENGTFGPQIFAGGAPNLVFTRLRGLAAHFFRSPLSAVTTLHVDMTRTVPVSHEHLRDMLLASPCLTNLSLYGNVIDPASWPHNGGWVINLPALRSLRLCGPTNWAFMSIFASISAPQLQSLLLKDCHEHDLDPYLHGHNNRFPQLESLTFYDFEFSECTYQKVFSAFPMVDKFTLLHLTTHTPVILRLLASASSSSNDLPWPNLGTLCLLFNFDDTPWLQEVVEKRIMTKKPLAKLRLGTSSIPSCLELQTKVQIESFTHVDPWPDGLGYVDEDDVLFSE